MRTSGTKRARPIRRAKSPGTGDTALVTPITSTETSGTRLLSRPGPASTDPGPGPLATYAPDRTIPVRLHRAGSRLPRPGGGSAPCRPGAVRPHPGAVRSHPGAVRSHPATAPFPPRRHGQFRQLIRQSRQLIGGRYGPGSPYGASHGARTRSTAANRPSAVPVIRRGRATASTRLARGVAVILVATGFSSCCSAAHSESACC